MTLKEFSEKYDVPYHLVYGASYKVVPATTGTREREYPEQDVMIAVTETLKGRINYHHYLMQKDIAILKRMGVTVG